MNWLARWAFRRIVAPRIIGFIWTGFWASPGEILPPHDIEVIFRGK